MEYTEFIEKRNLLLDKINDADMVLVGIGEEFNENFKDIDKFPLLMSALEEVDVNTTLEWTVPHLEKRFLMAHNESPIINSYRHLARALEDKNYFILTICIDENIKKANFKEGRIVEPCGNYQMFQCSKKCNNELYPSAEFSDLVHQALVDAVGLDSLDEPKCPCCGAPLVFNNILCDENYVEDGYKKLWETYTKWLQGTLNKKICIVELGVGMNLPNVIRWPFEKIAFYNNNASFFRINNGIYQMTDELANKGISINMNAVDFLNKI